MLDAPSFINAREKIRTLQGGMGARYRQKVDEPLSELGKGRDIDMNPYHLLHKAENGLDSDILPQGLRECTPVEIKNSVVETGSHEDLASGSSLWTDIDTHPILRNLIYASAFSF